MFMMTYYKYTARWCDWASPPYSQWDKRTYKGDHWDEKKKKILAQDLTWGFLLDTASVWRSRQWPTSWSLPRCGTAFPSCPTRHGWAWLQCGSETTLQSQAMYLRLCRKTLTFTLLIQTQQPHTGKRSFGKSTQSKRTHDPHQTCT